MDSSAPNINYIWSNLIIEELIRSGADHFFLAPGSRSTPLALAVLSNPAAHHVIHFDERGTAFAALGYARATGRPGVWITTSGTAVANGFPAVVEAASDSIPLVLITADRPPELRDIGANQTIDQIKIFGNYVKWFFDLPAPTVESGLPFVATTVNQAFYRSMRSPAGPVHMNCMFREPLAPEADNTPDQPLPILDRLSIPVFSPDENIGFQQQRFESSRSPYTRYTPSSLSPDNSSVRELLSLLIGSNRGLIVVGRLQTKSESDAACALGAHLGVPVLPDIQSQLRLGGCSDRRIVIPLYDQILGSEDFQEQLKPDVVLHIGGRFTSKRLLQYLAKNQSSHLIAVHEGPSRLDPNHRVAWSFDTSIVSFAQAIIASDGERNSTNSGNDWLSLWKEASDKVDKNLKSYFSSAEQLSEPFVAHSISRWIPESHGLCLASSMPIRDFDRYALFEGAAVPVMANRGASGIDGTIATAVGFTLGHQNPCTLVIGDLAFLHDLNSLALLRSDRIPLNIVVINNNGGGIFSFLPISRFSEYFEPAFGTPHGMSFRSAADLFGLTYHQPQSPGEFEDVYQTASRAGESTLIEVVTDRQENFDLHHYLDKIALAD